jgi:glycosyltransferase involved in cell wall biosynthesis
MTKKLFLSICIPTYNQSDLLKIMLQALLPQLKGIENSVEVIISDNASTDDTEAVIDSVRHLGGFNYFKSLENEGPTANIVKCGKELAKGEFVWILGSHNLLAPNALEYLLDILKNNIKLNIIYTNFRCAKYPEQWPEQAYLGYNGEFEYIGNKDINNRNISEWKDLISIDSALCTQLYVHIIKANVWKSFWNNIDIPETFKSAIGTYPHTYMIVKTLINSPSFYIGEPLITIFNGAQHWGDLALKAKVYSLGLPELIREFKKQKLASSIIKEAMDFNKSQIRVIALASLKSHDFTLNQLLQRIVKGKALFLVPIVFSVYYNNSKNTFPKLYRKIKAGLKKAFQYFHNWRPARWINQFKGNS